MAGKKLIGNPPETPPPRTVDFEELEKKMVEVLVDSIKYVATTCGIAIAVYSQILQGYLKMESVMSSRFTQGLVFLPLLLWFLAIFFTVIGIYPRQYKAETDLDKQNVINEIRKIKRFWLKLVLYLFVLGFGLFVYTIGAQIWGVYPFSRS